MTAKAPRHLSTAARRWWKQVLEDYELSPSDQRLLEAACGAWDRAVEAREAIARDGLFYVDKAGQPKAHPAANIERDAKVLFARLVRELRLDGSGTPESRPPGLYNREA